MIANIFFVFLMRIFFNSPLSDVCSGMRIFHSSKKAEVIALDRNDLSFSIQFTAQVLLKRWKVAELAIPYRDRVGFSKLSVFRDGLTFLGVVLGKVFRKQR